MLVELARGASVRHGGEVLAVACGQVDGDLMLASGGADGAVRLWCAQSEVPAGDPLATHSDAVQAIAIHPGADGGALLASGGRDGRVCLWTLRADGASLIQVFSDHRGNWVSGLAFEAHPATGRLLLASSDAGFDGGPGAVVLRDALTGELIRQVNGVQGAVDGLAFCRPSKDLLMLVVVETARLGLVDIVSGQTQWIDDSSLGHPTCIAAVEADHGPVLFVGQDDGHITALDCGGGHIADGRQVCHSPVSSIAATRVPEGDVLVAAGLADGSIQVFSLCEARVSSPVISAHTAPVSGAAFTADTEGHRLLVTGGEDGFVRVWDPFNGASLGSPKAGHTGVAYSIALTESDGGTLLMASSGRDGLVRLWDAHTGQPIGPPVAGAVQAVDALKFGRRQTGLILASAGADGVTLWNVDDHAGLSPQTKIDTGESDAVVFGKSSDGQRWLASSQPDGTVWLTDLGDPTSSRVRGRAERGVASMAFWRCDSGDVLAVAGRDGSRRLWPLDDTAATVAELGTDERVTFLAAQGQGVVFETLPWKRHIPTRARISNPGGAFTDWVVELPGRGMGSTAAMTDRHGSIWLAYGDEEGIVRLYRWPDPQPLAASAPLGEGWVHSLALMETSDGQLMVAGAGQSIAVWKVIGADRSIGDDTASAVPEGTTGS